MATVAVYFFVYLIALAIQTGIPLEDRTTPRYKYGCVNSYSYRVFEEFTAMTGSPPRLLMVLAAGSLVWLSFAGCERNTPAPAPVTPVPNIAAPPAVEVEAGPFAEGRKVYQGQGCAKCHIIGDQIAGGPGGGPKGMMRVSLTKVGEKRSREYIIEHVRNAKTHTGKTRMPPYDEKAINDADMQLLADYLVSLK